MLIYACLKKIGNFYSLFQLTLVKWVTHYKMKALKFVNILIIWMQRFWLYFQYEFFSYLFASLSNDKDRYKELS